MDVKSYRAKSLQEALQMVREDLGPDAAVLETRQVPPNWWKGLLGQKMVQVTASREVNVAARFGAAPLPDGDLWRGVMTGCDEESSMIPPAHQESYRRKFRHDLSFMSSSATPYPSLELASDADVDADMAGIPESVFRLYAELVDVEMPENMAREMIARIRCGCSEVELADHGLLRQRLLRVVEDELNIGGPIKVNPGTRRVIALVGPTGVGKTTTIAKLAANFRLRERRRVGLITVDTYRIAAVEQLRTYADIIDLPMEVVSTPREMRDAVCRLSHLDLILMDTAGRSPRDEIKIQELKSLLSEAAADEVHLVLSATSGPSALAKTAKHFAEVGTTALLLTKLDEATGLGHLLPLLRASELPLSYTTNGQNVPDDIQSSDRQKLSRAILGMELAV